MSQVPQLVVFISIHESHQQKILPLWRLLWDRELILETKQENLADANVALFFLSKESINETERLQYLTTSAKGRGTALLGALIESISWRELEELTDIRPWSESPLFEWDSNQLNRFASHIEEVAREQELAARILSKNLNFRLARSVSFKKRKDWRRKADDVRLLRAAYCSDLAAPTISRLMASREEYSN